MWPHPYMRPAPRVMSVWHSCFINISNDFQLAMTTENYQGMTAVHLAAASGHLAIVQWLRYVGCELSTVDYYGNNLLHYSCMIDAGVKKDVPVKSLDFPLLRYILDLEILSPFQANNLSHGALHTAVRETATQGNSLYKPVKIFLSYLSEKLTPFERCLLGSVDDMDYCDTPDVGDPGLLYGDLLNIAIFSLNPLYLKTIIGHKKRNGEKLEWESSEYGRKSVLSSLYDVINQPVSGTASCLMHLPAVVENIKTVLENGGSFSGDCNGDMLMERGVYLSSPRLVKLMLLHGVSSNSSYLNNNVITPQDYPTMAVLIAGGMNLQKLRYCCDIQEIVQFHGHMACVSVCDPRHRT